MTDARMRPHGTGETAKRRLCHNPCQLCRCDGLEVTRMRPHGTDETANAALAIILANCANERIGVDAGMCPDGIEVFEELWAVRALWS